MGFLKQCMPMMPTSIKFEERSLSLEELVGKSMAFLPDGAHKIVAYFQL